MRPDRVQFVSNALFEDMPEQEHHCVKRLILRGRRNMLLHRKMTKVILKVAPLKQSRILLLNECSESPRPQSICFLSAVRHMPQPQRLLHRQDPPILI